MVWPAERLPGIEYCRPRDVFFYSLSQRWISVEAIIRFGKYGLIVPALTLTPSANRARANALASASFRNVSVVLAAFFARLLSSFTISKETYQVSLARSAIGPPFSRRWSNFEAANAEVELD
jgi:hypothetical protein